MFTFTYENQGTCTYLVYKFGNEVTDTMTLGMLTNNNIKGFAKAIYTEINNERYIKYNISAKISLSKLFIGSITKKRILNIFINILDAIMKVDDYMLDMQHVLFNQDYIFADVSSSEIAMICIPVISYAESVDLKEFFKNAIFSISFDSRENGDYIARIIAYLNNEEFSVLGFRQVLDELLSGNKAEGHAAPVNYTPNYKQNFQSNVQQNMRPAPEIPAISDAMVSNPYGSVGQDYLVSMQAEPNIQNIYSETPKEIKMAKRNEMQQEAAKAKVKTEQSPLSVQQDTGFAVPGMSENTVSTQKQKKGKKSSTDNISSEEDVSLFYLLQHYNKENAAKYKATKERKKKNTSGNGEEQKQSTQAYQTNKVQPPQTHLMPLMQPDSPEAGAVQMMPPQIMQPVPKEQPLQIPISTVEKQLRTYSSQQINLYQAERFPTDAYVVPSPGQNENPEPDNENDDFGTTVLTDEKQIEIKPYLYRLKNGEKLYLNKNTCKIGKNREVVDCYINHNTAISRCHAIIYKQDDKCYIEDLNSTNGTFVDDKQIVSNSKILLRLGSRIRLADEEFELRFG